jgi:hypothetical protein
MPLRAAADDEAEGLDVTMHGEEAYLHTGIMEAIPAAARPEKHGAVIETPVEA